jgi:hypothetical protein
VPGASLQCPEAVGGYLDCFAVVGLLRLWAFLCRHSFGSACWHVGLLGILSYTVTVSAVFGTAKPQGSQGLMGLMTCDFDLLPCRGGGHVPADVTVGKVESPLAAPLYQQVLVKLRM